MVHFNKKSFFILLLVGNAKSLHSHLREMLSCDRLSKFLPPSLIYIGLQFALIFISPSLN